MNNFGNVNLTLMNKIHKYLYHYFNNKMKGMKFDIDYYTNTFHQNMMYMNTYR